MITKRRHSGLGSQYHPVNNLAVVEASMKQNQVKHFRPIIKQGQWVVKSLGFKLEQKVQIRANVIGQGAGYLYASFGEGNDTELLDIKKVMQGIYQLTFIVPNTSLPNFRIGIASTIPKGYGIKYLSNETQYKIRTNSLMLQQHTPMYESPGIGFAGFGAFVDRSINDTPQGGKDSYGNPYWDGNLDNFDWETYKYSGRSSPVAKRPFEYGSYRGYHAHCSSTMTAVFDDNDQFLGWDALEEKNGKLAIQAGVPTCVVIQLFGRNGYDPRPDMNAGKKIAAAIMITLGAKSYLDPERFKPQPEWFYMDNITLPPGNIVFMSSDFNHVMPRYASSNADVFSSGGMTKAGSGPLGRTGYMGLSPTYKLLDIPSYGAKLEWYNPETGSWSTPMASPNFGTKTNSKGFLKYIFRVPRQLNPETDKDIISQIQAAGMDYSFETTKKCIPTFVSGDFGGNVGTVNKDMVNYIRYTHNIPENFEIAHAVLGRPNETDTYYREDGTNELYYAPKDKTMLSCFFDYPSHSNLGHGVRDGGQMAHTPGDDRGWAHVIGADILVGDVEKFARMNYPEIYTAFWPWDGFKTGNRVYAIGRGLSTSSRQSLSVNKLTDPSDSSVSKGSTEDNIATKSACIIKPKYLINSTEIEDGIMSSGELEIKKHWKETFGVELSEDFFISHWKHPENKSGQQSETNPLLNTVYDPGSGLYFDIPYQIMIYEVETTYDGPAVFYGTKTVNTTDPETLITTAVLKSTITKPEGKPYARGKGEPVFLNTRTPFRYIKSHEIDILQEFEEQLGVINDGGSNQGAIGGENPLNNEPEDITAAINTQRIIDDWMKLQQEGRTEYQSTKGNKKYVRLQDVVNPNPEFYREGSISLDGLKGFSNTRDFYVEDVTTKWTANESQGLSGYSGMGNVLTDAAGNTFEFAQDSIFSPVREALAENIGDGVSFLKTTGKFAIYSYLAFKLIPLAAKATVSTYDVFNRPTRPTTAARRRARRRSGKRR